MNVSKDDVDDARFQAEALQEQYGDRNVYHLGDEEVAEALGLPSLHDEPNLVHIRLGDYRGNGYSYRWVVDCRAGRLYVKQKVAE